MGTVLRLCLLQIVKCQNGVTLLPILMKNQTDCDSVGFSVDYLSSLTPGVFCQHQNLFEDGCQIACDDSY